MTFSEYWKDNEPFGWDAEEVARLAFNAAVAAERERCAKIAEAAPGEYTPHMEMGWPTNHPIRCEFAVRIANKIRSGE